MANQTAGQVQASSAKMGFARFLGKLVAAVIIVVLCLYLGARWFGSEDAADVAQETVLRLTHPSNQSVQDLLEARHGNRDARRDQEIAQLDRQAQQARLLASTTENQNVGYLSAEIVGDTDGLIDSEHTTPLRSGEVVRYYPEKGHQRFSGDSKLYVCVGQPPFKVGDFLWVPTENVRLQDSNAEWLKAAAVDSKTVTEWVGDLAPGQYSPELTIPIPSGMDLAWHLRVTGDGTPIQSRINRGTWTALVGGPNEAPGPHLQGSVTLQVRVDPFHNRVERIRFILEKRS